jgi:hypothetical protein
MTSTQLAILRKYLQDAPRADPALAGAAPDNAALFAGFRPARVLRGGIAGLVK